MSVEQPATRAADRCSVISTLRGDALAGTASHVRGFLLLEDPGPWGADAWRDARLPDGLGEQVLSRCAAQGIKPLLIRRQRDGRFISPPDPLGRVGRRVFAIWPSPAGGWIETTIVSDPRHLLDLDLSALAAGRSVGLERWREPIFAVCTHGRHDTCCAELGRPVAAAVDEVEPEHTWQTSHQGGDRFAGNLLIFGEGLWYGRLDPSTAQHVVAEYRSGRIVLDQLRGRSSWTMSAQAAEIELRRRLGATGLGQVSLLGERRAGADRVVDLAVLGQGSWSVTVREIRLGSGQLTCRAAGPRAIVRWDVEQVTRHTG